MKYSIIEYSHGNDEKSYYVKRRNCLGIWRYLTSSFMDGGSEPKKFESKVEAELAIEEDYDSRLYKKKKITNIWIVEK